MISKTTYEMLGNMQFHSHMVYICHMHVGLCRQAMQRMWTPYVGLEKFRVLQHNSTCKGCLGPHRQILVLKALLPRAEAAQHR